MGAMARKSSPVWRLRLNGGPKDRALGLGYGFPVHWRKSYRAEVWRTGGEGGELRVLQVNGQRILVRTVHVPAGKPGPECVIGWVRQIARFLNDRECPGAPRSRPVLSYCS